MQLVFQGLPVNPPDVVTWLYLFAVSICGCIGQTTLSAGAQMIDASTTAVIRNCDIGFVLIWQIFLLQQFPTKWSIMGLVLITSCTLIMAFTKSTKLPSDLNEEERVDNSISGDIELEEISST